VDIRDRGVELRIADAAAVNERRIPASGIKEAVFAVADGAIDERNLLCSESSTGALMIRQPGQGIGSLAQELEVGAYTRLQRLGLPTSVLVSVLRSLCRLVAANL
jgi:hypothetical protein